MSDYAIQVNEEKKQRDVEGVVDNEEYCSMERLLAGEYNIIRPLGCGAQGRVYLAEDVSSGKKVAIKQLVIKSVKDWKSYDLFRREAETLKRLDIKGVAKIDKAAEFLECEIPQAIIVQEYIEGETLQNLIEEGHRFQLCRIGAILMKLTSIVEQLHHSNPPVIHRDIKPSNIIVNYSQDVSDPEIYLIDFGAVANPQIKTGGSTVVGTYGYMAPEQLLGHACEASDIYSLAVVAVYLLSGVAPENIQMQDFQMLIDPHLEHLPHQVTAVLRKMLASKVEERLVDYQTIRKFFEAIKTQNFDSIPAVWSKDEVNASLKLQDVHAFLQAGNIDIWQSLSDEKPRKLPKQLKYLLACLTVLTRMNCKKQEVYYPVTLKDIYRADKAFKFIALMFVMFLCIPLVIWLTPYMFEGFEFDLMFEMPYWMYYLGLVVVFIPFALYPYMKVRWCMSVDGRRKDSLISRFQNARKSMATVVDVTYLSVGQDLEMSQRYNCENESYRATWRVIYSFNPPDDSSAEPILRTFITHAVPARLKPGSLIPILYTIEDGDSEEHVYSTPYPMPYSDTYCMSDK